MASYIAEKYAGILTKEDVNQLFDVLTERLQGNRSEAARQCGLTGKATYDWETVAYIKFRTKKKVLEACLGTNFLATVEYLLKRSNERTVDILRTFLSTLYQGAIEADSKDQFSDLFDRFQALRKKYRGLIKDEIEDEVTDMVWLLSERASEFQMPPSEKSFEDVSLREWLDVFPAIVDAYVENPQQAQAMAEALDFPRESTKILWPNFEKLRPGKLTTEAQLGEVFHFEVKTTTEVKGWIRGKDTTLSEGPFAQKFSKKPVHATVTADDKMG